MTEYKVANDFQVDSARVLELDRDLDIKPQESRAFIDGIQHEYTLNSVRKWLVLSDSHESFEGKTVVFK